MRAHAFALVLAANATFACALDTRDPAVISPDNLERCPSTSAELLVTGEAANIDGAVSVVVTEDAGSVSLVITPAEDSSEEHVAQFELAGADVDTIDGDVTAEVGVVFAGEGFEYGYLRLTDERGVWFEGGRTSSIDGDSEGGAKIDAPFRLGDETDAACKLNRITEYSVAIHEVVADFDDGSVALSETGVNGVWRGVDVRAVGVLAHQGVYEEPTDVADGLGPGPHDMIEVVGYLYRTAP